jgi:hypothetical protein
MAKKFPETEPGHDADRPVTSPGTKDGMDPGIIEHRLEIGSPLGICPCK